MTNKIKPFGKAGPGIWSEWKSPEDWTKFEIPKCPGEYQLRSKANVVKSHLSKVAFGRSARPVPCEEFRDILYIGETQNLYDRFWLLVRSWKKPTPSHPHTSRKNWENDPVYQSLVPEGEMECRWRRLSSVGVKTIRSNKSAKATAKGASLTAETFSLLKYGHCFGSLPPLNKKPPIRLKTRKAGPSAKNGRGEDAIDDGFLNDLTEQADRDASSDSEVEINVPDDGRLHSLIEEAKRTYGKP